MQLSAKEADGSDQVAEPHRCVCLQESYIIVHGLIIKILMDDDGVDWILFMSNHFGIHLSYANHNNGILPREKARDSLEAKAAWELHTFLFIFTTGGRGLEHSSNSFFLGYFLLTPLDPVPRKSFLNS